MYNVSWFACICLMHNTSSKRVEPNHQNNNKNRYAMINTCPHTCILMNG